MTKMKREKTKSEMQRGDNNKHPWKSRESSETTLRTYIPINWKILKKWKNF
jgi:hypothetical protein